MTDICLCELTAMNLQQEYEHLTVCHTIFFNIVILRRTIVILNINLAIEMQFIVKTIQAEAEWIFIGNVWKYVSFYI